MVGGVVVAGVLGLMVGSFVNVVVHRVPRGESIVKPSSQCPGCGRAIRPYDNIPVASWLMLRGRCRDCRMRIPARYPLVEMATMAVWVSSAVRFAGIEVAIFVAVTVTVLLALSVIDLEHHRLPNVIAVPSTGVALVWVVGFTVATGDAEALWMALLGGAAAFSLLLVIALVSGGMGFGDVKLAAFIGIVTGRFGWEVTVEAIFFAFVVGGLVALTLLVARRAERKQRIPFGPWLAVGATVALFAGPGPVRAWLGL